MSDVYLDDPALRAAFVAESAEHLASLERGLLQVERGGSGDDLLRTLLRSAHTLKASARLFRLDPAAEIAHQLEEALIGFQRGIVRPESDLISTLLRSLDALRAAVRLPEAPAEAPAPASVGSAPATPPASIDYVRVPVPRLEAVFRLADGWPRLLQEQRRLGDLLARLVAEIGALRRTLAERVGDDATAIQDRCLDVQLASEVALRQHRAISRSLGEDTAQLQARLGELRLQPLANVLAPLARAVREEAVRQGKDVALVITGDDVELDDHVLQGLGEPLTHLVRNALDHGIEEPAERRAHGKPERGTIAVTTRVRADVAVIEVRDDGRGVDLARVREQALRLGLLSPGTAASPGEEELLALLFQPGFTTRATVDATSGRGVGMDIVRERIARLGGRIDIETGPRQGTVIRLSVPLAASTARVLLAVAGGAHYAIPTVLARGVAPTAESPLPVLDLLARGVASGSGDGGFVVLLGEDEQANALRVDFILGESAAVLRPFNAAVGRPPFVSGGTVLPDGTLALVLDPAKLLEHGPPLAARQRALVAAESSAARTWLREALHRAGWATVGAANGYQALAIAVHGGVKLVVADSELPGLDGAAVALLLRADARTADLPLIVVSAGGDAPYPAALPAGTRIYSRAAPGGQERLAEAAAEILAQAVLR